MEKKHLRTVLSLFDGMSCAQIALGRAGITFDHYLASEIDKHAIKVTQSNYPETVQMGDINEWRTWSVDWSKVDLVCAGSPCQGFSFAGKQLAFDDPRSKLFFVFVDILHHIYAVNPDNFRFLLENVRMKKEHLAVITKMLGVEPVVINSNLVSAQNRYRLYWANWGFGQPNDKNTKLVDILENGYVDVEKAKCLVARYKASGQRSQPRMKARYFEGKTSLEQIVKCGAMRGRYIVDGKRSDVGSLKGKTTQRIEIGKGVKTNCLTTVAKDNLVVYPHCDKTNFEVGDVYFRLLTPVECERLQTVEDGYTNHVSNSQRYRMLGNGWTVDAVAHIFKSMTF